MPPILPLLVVAIVTTFAPGGRLETLAAAIHDVDPHVSLERAHDHALAALLAEAPHAPAEQLLGMVAVESDWNPLASPGKLWSQRSHHGLKWFTCGVMQTTVLDWNACVALRSLEPSYVAGVAHLLTWREHCWRRYHLRDGALDRCALHGYDPNPGYIERVERAVDKIRSACDRRRARASTSAS